MSYDLMVFEAKAAPKNRADFMRWYEQQTQWSEGHSYDDMAVCSPALQSWMGEMKEHFRPMNGSFAPTNEELDALEDEESRLTDYSMGRDVIYAAFAWSVAEEAHALTRSLAAKHGVGFFDVSANEGEILFPDGTAL